MDAIKELENYPRAAKLELAKFFLADADSLIHGTTSHFLKEIAMELITEVSESIKQDDEATDRGE